MAEKCWFAVAAAAWVGDAGGGAGWGGQASFSRLVASQSDEDAASGRPDVQLLYLR